MKLSRNKPKKKTTTRGTLKPHRSDETNDECLSQTPYSTGISQEWVSASQLTAERRAFAKPFPVEHDPEISATEAVFHSSSRRVFRRYLGSAWHFLSLWFVWLSLVWHRVSQSTNGYLAKRDSYKRKNESSNTWPVKWGFHHFPFTLFCSLLRFAKYHFVSFEWMNVLFELESKKFIMFS